MFGLSVLSTKLIRSGQLSFARRAGKFMEMWRAFESFEQVNRKRKIATRHCFQDRESGDFVPSRAKCKSTKFHLNVHSTS